MIVLNWLYLTWLDLFQLRMNFITIVLHPTQVLRLIIDRNEHNERKCERINVLTVSCDWLQFTHGVVLFVSIPIVFVIIIQKVLKN